jgi:hypothetical protein
MGLSAWSFGTTASPRFYISWIIVPEVLRRVKQEVQDIESTHYFGRTSQGAIRSKKLVEGMSEETAQCSSSIVWIDAI